MLSFRRRRLPRAPEGVTERAIRAVAQVTRMRRKKTRRETVNPGGDMEPPAQVPSSECAVEMVDLQTRLCALGNFTYALLERINDGAFGEPDVALEHQDELELLYEQWLTVLVFEHAQMNRVVPVTLANERHFFTSYVVCRA